MKFPLTKREKDQIKEIGEAFGTKNPLCIPDESELLPIKDILELLIQTGYVKTVHRTVIRGYSQVEISGFELVGKFTDFLAWVDDQEKKAKKLSRREWKIGLVSAGIGLIPFVVTMLATWLSK